MKTHLKTLAIVLTLFTTGTIFILFVSWASKGINSLYAGIGFLVLLAIFLYFMIYKDIKRNSTR